jgi:hypothetical protein
VPRDLHSYADHQKCDNAQGSMHSRSRELLGSDGGVGTESVGHGAQQHDTDKEPQKRRNGLPKLRLFAWALRVSVIATDPGPTVMGNLSG